MVKNYIFSEFKEHAGWHVEPSSIFKANLIRAHENIGNLFVRKLLSPLTVVRIRDNILVGTVGNLQVGEVKSGVPIETRRVFGKPSSPSSEPLFPDGTAAKCTVGFQRDEWACLQRGSVALERMVAVFAPKSALGSSFQLRTPQGGLQTTFVGPDGFSISQNPEDVLVTVFSGAEGAAAAPYEWAVSYEVRPNDSCPDGGYESRDSRVTKWATPSFPDGLHSGMGSGWETACSFEAFYGTAALRNWSTFVPRFPCNRIPGQFTSDLYNVDSALLGTVGDPYRDSLELHFNPFAGDESEEAGMGAAAYDRMCQYPYAPISSSAAGSVREGMRTLLQQNPVSGSPSTETSAVLGSENVPRDFCGKYRGSDPTAGAFEVGSTCPWVFAL